MVFCDKEKNKNQRNILDTVRFFSTNWLCICKYFLRLIFNFKHTLLPVLSSLYFKKCSLNVLKVAKRKALLCWMNFGRFVNQEDWVYFGLFSVSNPKVFLWFNVPENYFTQNFPQKVCWLKHVLVQHMCTWRHLSSALSWLHSWTWCRSFSSKRPITRGDHDWVSIWSQTRYFLLQDERYEALDFDYYENSPKKGLKSSDPTGLFKWPNEPLDGRSE